jgi:hypothetical protein
MGMGIGGRLLDALTLGSKRPDGGPAIATPATGKGAGGTTTGGFGTPDTFERVASPNLFSTAGPQERAGGGGVAELFEDLQMAAKQAGTDVGSLLAGLTDGGSETRKALRGAVGEISAGGVEALVEGGTAHTGGGFAIHFEGDHAQVAGPDGGLMLKVWGDPHAEHPDGLELPGRAAEGLLGGVATLDVTMEAVDNALESMTEKSDLDQTRLQIYADRLSNAMEMLSNVLKKMSDTSSAIVQNMK